MRRADRLFRIVQRLRRKTVTRASDLAEHLGVSERTIYRDIRDLVLSGVPIVGEAGVGYALPKSYELPPLMFTEEEIEALVLGARVVRSWADPELAGAAEEALAKIENALPARLKARIPDATLFAPDFHVPNEHREHMATLRGAIRAQHRVRFAYQDRAQARSERTVQPLGLFYWGRTWSLGAWCELREGFRNFRLDRMAEVAVLDPFPSLPGRTLRDLFKYYEEEEARARANPLNRSG